MINKFKAIGALSTIASCLQKKEATITTAAERLITEWMRAAT
tara:strand:- start:263 stop:388 length:126 start_codon:yes stop_codon:yes gene_type:complete